MSSLFSTLLNSCHSPPLLDNTFLVFYGLHHEFHLQSRHCVFLGYTPEEQGYKVLDLETMRIMESKDVMFYKNIFLFSNRKCEEEVGAKSPFS